MKLRDIILQAFYVNIRHLLQVGVGALITYKILTADTFTAQAIEVFALCIATYLFTMGYALLKKLLSKYKFLGALNAEPGTPESIIRLDAAAQLQQDVPVTKLIPTAILTSGSTEAIR